MATATRTLLLKNKIRFPLEFKKCTKKNPFRYANVIQQIRGHIVMNCVHHFYQMLLIGAFRELAKPKHNCVCSFKFNWSEFNRRKHHYDVWQNFIFISYHSRTTNKTQIKHSEATIVSIFLWEENNCYFPRLRDNGKGFNIDNSLLSYSSILGLSGIKRKASINWWRNTYSIRL